MKKLIGLSAVLVALFLSGNVFAQNLTIVLKYEVAKQDLVKTQGCEGVSCNLFSRQDAVTGCKNYTENSKGGFKLPAKEMLNAMYEQLHKKGVGGFANTFYWSSSESNGNNEWSQSFLNGYQSNYHMDFDKHVRCVRAL